MPPKKTSAVKKGNTNAKKARAEPDDTRADAAAHAADGAAARARARRTRPCAAMLLLSHLHRARCPGHRVRCSSRLARRATAVASSHALPHARRADRPIKKKPQGKRNLPADEVVSKWLIIETLERATPEEIIQLAFCVCLSE